MSNKRRYFIQIEGAFIAMLTLERTDQGIHGKLLEDNEKNET